MRALAATMALAATLALAGCSGSQEPHSPVDPEEAEAADYAKGAILTGAVVLATLILVGAVLLMRRRRRQRSIGTAAGSRDHR